MAVTRLDPSEIDAIAVDALRLLRMRLPRITKVEAAMDGDEAVFTSFGAAGETYETRSARRKDAADVARAHGAHWKSKL